MKPKDQYHLGMSKTTAANGECIGMMELSYCKENVSATAPSTSSGRTSHYEYKHERYVTPAWHGKRPAA